MSDTTTETRFAVARRGALVSDTYPTPQHAIDQARWMTETAASIGQKLRHDVVTVEVTTTVGPPTPYVPEDDTEPLTEEPEPETEQNPEADAIKAETENNTL